MAQDHAAHDAGAAGVLDGGAGFQQPGQELW